MKANPISIQGGTGHIGISTDSQMVTARFPLEMNFFYSVDLRGHSIDIAEPVTGGVPYEIIKRYRDESFIFDDP